MALQQTENDLKQLEDELHVEILPGTEVMTDVGSHHFVKGSSSHKVLVPQPSDSPDDPLNWTPFWKTATIICASWVTFTQGFGPLSLAPMFEFYIQDFHSNLPDVVQFTGVAILVLGFSNFIWVPFASTFGKRPALLLSQFINLGAAIWRAKATSYGSFMGACVLNGIGAGPAETFQPAIIADLYFLHDRGKWNTLYWVVYMGSLMVAPIISGPMAANTNWRNFWWLYVGMIALSIIMILFIYPETTYHRAALDINQTEKVQDEKLDEAEKPTATELTREATETRDPWLGRGRPSKSQFGFYTKNPNWWQDLFINIWIPWKLFAFPIVEFTSFVVSWSCSCFLTLNLTQTQAFAAPPYMFSSQAIGFFNFAILGGSFIGLALGGPLSDYVSMRATIKNGGVREPEMRLPSMIPWVLIMIFGNVIVAVGYQNKWPWQAIVIIGYACAGIQVATLPAIAMTYAVDSYKPAASQLMVSVTVNKNVWGYGFSKFITPWIVADGYIKPIMLNMTLTAIWCSFGILFWWQGKNIRRWSRNSSIHRL